MRHIYMQSNEHFEVFTTVLAPQGRYRAGAEKMVVVVHSHRPHCPDELEELPPGDVITVLPNREEEERWFGRLQEGRRRGYFPASCVMELGRACVNFTVEIQKINTFLKVTLPPKAQRRSLSLRSSAWDDAGSRHGNGHILQAHRRGSRGGGIGGAAGLDGGQGESEGPCLTRRPQIPAPQPMASQPQTHRSPGLLRTILSKCRRKTECQGASNEAFEGD